MTHWLILKYICVQMMLLGSDIGLIFIAQTTKNPREATSPLDQVHVGLVRGWQCAYAFCRRSQTSYETAEKSMPLCLKTLASALLSNTVWTVQLDMRGLRNLLSNFLIQLSTLNSHVLFSADISFRI